MIFALEEQLYEKDVEFNASIKYVQCLETNLELYFHSGIIITGEMV